MSTAGILRFLGGLNLAFAALNVMVLLHAGSAYMRPALTILFLTFAIAHGSQFTVNLPIALDERRGRPVPWSALSGIMLLIFLVDGLLTIANFLATT